MSVLIVAFIHSGSDVKTNIGYEALTRYKSDRFFLRTLDLIDRGNKENENILELQQHLSVFEFCESCNTRNDL